MKISKENELRAYNDIQRKIIIILKNALNTQLNNNRTLFNAFLKDNEALNHYRKQSLKNMENVTAEFFLKTNGYEWDTEIGWKEKK